jgi:XTP/dITP diphosphohydrolase
MDVLIATGNAGKVREFRQMLSRDGLAWHDLSQFTDLKTVEETGGTFEANAALKAAGYARQTGLWALADDSGLEVDALAGRPGVHSARWAVLNDAGQGDADNNALLLRQLEAVPDGQRSARFVCALALANPAGEIILSARDTVEGQILKRPRGANGFGYDPLFLIDATGQTTAEMAPDHKHQISHRGKALRTLRRMMDDINFGSATL